MRRLLMRRATKSNRRKRVRAWALAWTIRWIRRVSLGFLAVSTLLTLAFRFIPPPITPLMAIRCLEKISDREMPSIDKDWVPLKNISPNLRLAVIAAEDQRFFQHHGFDWDSMRAAFRINLEGKRRLGASTITQQVAKNVFLWPGRNWLRKALEAYFTLLLEVFWSKERILEVYLNVMETGDGIFGAQAAGMEYFRRPASKLSPSQSALLAATLPNPRRWSAHRPSPYILRRQAWILNQMEHMGPYRDYNK